MKSLLFSIFVMLIPLFLLAWNLLNSKPYKDYWDNSYNYWDERILTRDEAIENYWDEIKDYVDGSEIIEACSLESENCYTLEADISNGAIETVYFSNGGYLYFFADIDENGDAWDMDQYGNTWDFKIDMDSPIINNAIDEWAHNNGYIIK